MNSVLNQLRREREARATAAASGPEEAGRAGPPEEAERPEASPERQEPERGARQLRTPLLLACELGAAGSATLLMDAGASLAATDKTDKTPLHWLSQHGCAEALTLALRKGAGQRDVRVGV